MIWLILIILVILVAILLIRRCHTRDYFSLTNLPFKQRLNTDPNNLVGVIDTHTHLMSHLGFGGHLLHGTPDVGCLTLAGTIYETTGAKWPATRTCNKETRPTTSVAESIGTCRATHGTWNPIKNPCGNVIRNFVISQFEQTNKTNEAHKESEPSGYPNFIEWPKYNDILHQQMWIDWIRRAYDGGLRMIVALAVNNYALATGLQPNGNVHDDKTSVDLQINEIKAFAQRHSSWMEVAYSSSDLRRIIGSEDKFAIVIGTEYDDIGNFILNKIIPTKEQIQDEIQRLYNNGVRYMFPVHVADNLLGGTAIYEKAFFAGNRYQFGKWVDVECATKDSGVTHLFNDTGLFDTVLGDVLTNVELALVGGKLGVQTFPKCSIGHVNKRGLQKLGEYAIEKMMSLHMMIDIDHMSYHTKGSVIELTTNTNYPLMSGHSTYPTKTDNAENSTTVAVYKTIAKRGGMAGIHIRDDLKTTINVARKIARLNVPLAIGSDINGYVTLNPPPGKPLVTYSSSFPKLTTGDKTFDYNTEGMVNIGLYPDFLRAMVASGGGDIVTKLFKGAENFAKMWGKCERN